LAAVQPTSTPATTSDDHPTTPISICNCGCVFATQFYTSRRTLSSGVQHYGPAYNGHLKLRDSPAFAIALQQNKMTQEEFDVIGAMSTNEGNVDAIQSWDSEVVTVGAMQKTINSTGHGELSTQIAAFKSRNLAAYNELFAHCGWNVQGSGAAAKTTYTHATLTNGVAKTGNDLKVVIRLGFDEQAYTAHHGVHHTAYPPDIPLGSLLQAISDIRYVSLQVDDFIARYHDVLELVVPNTNGSKVGDIFHTKIGRATALDQHVNRPSYVAPDIAMAIHHIGTPFNNWPTDIVARKILELHVIGYYGIHRRMNEGANVPRFHALQSILSDN
jgi:hypothetical protein